MSGAVLRRLKQLGVRAKEQRNVPRKITCCMHAVPKLCEKCLYFVFIIASTVSRVFPVHVQTIEAIFLDECDATSYEDLPFRGISGHLFAIRENL